MQYITKSNLYSSEFTFTECDGSATDLSRSTVKFIIKRNPIDSDDQALLSREYVNPDTNILKFEFSAQETADLVEGSAFGALKIFREGDRNEELWKDEYLIDRGVFND